MDFRAENFYAAWRQNGRAETLHEGAEVPPEKLLQAIWQHQRLKRAELKTADGQPVRVLHPGFASVEGGPDFRGAVIKIGEAAPASGEVEVDLQISGWRAHGHDKNPAFQKVILHVVWEANHNSKSRTENSPIVLPLKNVLDAPLAELALALEHESSWPESLRGKCCAPLRELSPAQLTELLHGAAKVRFQNKAQALLARAKSGGWEQALWEQLFRALGYKHNVWPMLHLAETRARWLPAARTTPEIQTRLLGVSGLLPTELTPKQRDAESFLRRTWDGWWRERDALADCILPRSAWRFHGLRPANHPQRRLALAAHWLAREKLVEQIEAWILDRPNADWLTSLQTIFQVEQDEFWSWHWTFNSARMLRPQPLLGAARVTDLAINAVLPWLWVRAREGGNAEIQRAVEERFRRWPAAEDNAVLKLARQRLLGAASARVLKGAAEQQGLMQIVRDFCEHSNALCADCRFPELVAGFKLQVAG